MKVKHIWGKIPDNWRMSSQSEYDNCCPKKYYSKLQLLWRELRDIRCLFIGITKLHRIYPYNLSIYSEKATKFATSSPYFWPQYIQTKVRWRYCKILWLPQNIWTLKTCPIIWSSPCNWKLGQNVLLRSLDLDINSAEALSTSSSEWFFSAINDARFVTLSMSDEHQNRDELLAERSLLEIFNSLYFVERWLLDWIGLQFRLSQDWIWN